MTNKQLKRAMVNHARGCAKHEEIPQIMLDSELWGKGSKVLAWRITNAHTKHPATSQAAVKAVLYPKPQYTIRHDYKAVHSSGTAGGKKLIVIHDMEVDAPKTAAEAVGNYFEMRSSGGSTQYGIDNDSIQQYLPDMAIPWGAPYANTQGIHIEQMGKASWSTEKWMHYALPTIDRTAWLIAHLSKKHLIPIRSLSDSELRKGLRGVVTHAQCSRVFGGTHTDPGSNYPFHYLLDKAREYAR